MKRLTLSLLVAAITAILGLGWAIDQWYKHQINPREHSSVVHFRSMGKQIVDLIDLANVDNDTLARWVAQSGAQLQFVDYDDFPLPPDLKESFERGEPLLLDSGKAISLHYFISARHAVLSLQFENVDDANQSTLSWLLTILFYLGVITVLLLWLFPLLSRLSLLRRHAQAFGAGNLSARISPSGFSYISDIENDFNRMAQKIENLVHDNKLLSRGLSHDLRTPLARLRFGLDVLEEAQLNEQQQKTLAHLNRDLTAMESLVEILLTYARLEQGNIALTLKSLDLSEFVKSIKNEFYPDEITVNCLPETQPCEVKGDANYLSMLLHNLIQNALRHGNGTVQLNLLQKENCVVLTVEDNGSGIPQAERDHVFKPFYRVPSSANTQGHGMGLAIVERIVQWHGAIITLGHSESLKGLKVEISFPSCSLE